MISLAIALAGLAAGTLIGMTGIGGVLLVPVLTEVGAMPADRAIGTSTAAFLLGGVAAAVMHLRHVAPAPRIMVPLCIAAIVGALTGAATIDYLTPQIVRWFISFLALFSGAFALVAPLLQKRFRDPRPWEMVVLGVLVGYGSAISGTGGPALLVPLLLILRTEIRLAVALGLLVQIPITLSATVINAHAGRIDYPLAMLLAMLVLVGTLAGGRLARYFSGRTLTLCVAVTLMGLGVWYGVGSSV